jgi:tyrosine-protein kinase Etk/Wzc
MTPNRPPVPVEPEPSLPTVFDPQRGRLPEDRETPVADDDVVDLRKVWAVLRRNLRVLLLCAASGGAAGLYYATAAMPEYEASASLRITANENSVPGLEALQALTGGANNEVNTELEVLRSRTLAGEVVDEFGLRAAVRGPGKCVRSALFSRIAVEAGTAEGEWVVDLVDTGFRVTGPDGRAATGAPGLPIAVGGLSVTPIAGEAWADGNAVLTVVDREVAITRLATAVRSSRPNRDANVLLVRYRGTDPELVAGIPNAIVRAFVTRRVGVRKTTARSTVDFLRSQLDTLKGELRSAEDALLAFREREKVVNVQQQALVSVGKLAELQAQRSEVAAELEAIDATLAAARSEPRAAADPSPYRRLLAFPTLLRNQSLSTLLQSVTTLENERTTLLVRRTPADPDVVALTQQIDALENQIAGLIRTYATGLRQQVAAVDRVLGSSNAQLALVPEREITLARLERNAVVLTELSTLLQTRLKEAEVSEAVEDPSAQVIDFAVRPTRPVFPKTAQILLIGLLLGTFAGVAGAFGREALDTKLHNREELQQLAPSMPVLGLIPHFSPDSARGIAGMLPGAAGPEQPGSRLVVLRDPKSTVLEAYRALRTSLAFIGPQGAPKVLIVSSPHPGDGKSTTSLNLASAIAQQQQRVLIIDGDMRRGALHRALGGDRTPGLSEILTGQVTVDQTIQSVDIGGVGSIDLIPTGTVPPNPAELLGSSAMRELLSQLEHRYDTILIDTPPVNVVADVLTLAAKVGSVLLVTRAGQTDRAAVQFAVEQLRQVRANVLGTILNDFDMSRAAYSYGGYYRYYYGSSYGPEE